MNKKFGENIIRARKEAGLEQQDLALLLDYTQPSVSRWENNKVDCPAYVLEKISKITNKPIEWFFQDHSWDLSDNQDIFPNKQNNLHNLENKTIQKPDIFNSINSLSSKASKEIEERIDAMDDSMKELLNEFKKTNELLTTLVKGQISIVQGQEEIKKNADKNNRLLEQLDKIQQQNEQFAEALLLLEAGEISSKEVLNLFYKLKKSR